MGQLSGRKLNEFLAQSSRPARRQALIRHLAAVPAAGNGRPQRPYHRYHVRKCLEPAPENRARNVTTISHHRPAAQSASQASCAKDCRQPAVRGRLVSEPLSGRAPSRNRPRTALRRAGADENRWPNPLFDPDWFARHAGSRGGRKTPLERYLALPVARRPSTHPLIDPDWYRQRHSDRLSPDQDVLEHFLVNGAAREALAASRVRLGLVSGAGTRMSGRPASTRFAITSISARPRAQSEPVF